MLQQYPVVGNIVSRAWQVSVPKATEQLPMTKTCMVGRRVTDY